MIDQVRGRKPGAEVVAELIPDRHTCGQPVRLLESAQIVEHARVLVGNEDGAGARRGVGRSGARTRIWIVARPHERRTVLALG